eukprot:2877333-Rhodomonas_salina.1
MQCARFVSISHIACVFCSGSSICPPPKKTENIRKRVLAVSPVPLCLSRALTCTRAPFTG